MEVSPYGAPGFTFASATHPGLLRSTNEDSHGVCPAHRAFVVCDGMGGAAAGEVASHLAVQTFLERIASPPAPPPERLTEAIQAANHAILHRAAGTPSLCGMGTTLVAALFHPAPALTLWLAHVGDSRCYRFRAPTLSLLTADHSIVEEQVRAGRLTRHEADLSPVRHVITRALGAQPDVDPEIQQIDVSPGDLLLLASDGLNRELSEEEVAQILAAIPPNPPQQALQAACQHLVDAANHHGGHDNVTVLLLHLG